MDIRTNESTKDTFLSVFMHQRARLLHHTSSVLQLTDDASGQQTVSQLTGLLASALEELQVTEEELTEQNNRLAQLQFDADRELRKHRVLFDLAPAPLLVTTLQGVIREANRAAAALLDNTAYFLEGKPLAALIPVGERNAFRAGLARMSATDGTTDWVFSISRRTHGVSPVCATVQLTPAEGSEVQLYWHLSLQDAPAIGGLSLPSESMAADG